MAYDFSNLQMRRVDSDTLGKLPAGAYVCKIYDAQIEEINGRPQLVCDIDIAEGEFAGFFEKRFQSSSWGWDKGAKFKRYIQDESENCTSRGFSIFIDRLEKENPGFHFEIPMLYNLKVFCGLLCGFTFREEEFVAKDTNEVKTTVKIQFPQKIQDIRDGKIKTPKPYILPDDKRPDKQVDNFEFDANSLLDGAEKVNNADVPF